MVESILKTRAECKGYMTTQRSLLITALIIATCLTSFGLGRRFALQTKPEPVTIRDNRIFLRAQEAGVLTYDEPEGLTQVTGPSEPVVASKNGTRYYFPTCSGASRIKEENKVTFASIALAQAAGYTAASNCEGLR